MTPHLSGALTCPPVNLASGVRHDLLLRSAIIRELNIARLSTVCVTTRVASTAADPVPRIGAKPAGAEACAL